MLTRDAVPDMSLAAETRRAVNRHPFLRTALRAGVVNYTAAARYLDVDGETDAIATALRRYAEELPAYETESRDARVRMESGIGALEGGGDERGSSTDGNDALVTVGGTAFGPSGGDRTAIVATGDVDTAALAAVLARLSLEDISPTAAAVADGTLVVVVARLEGANALRAVEAALDRVDVRIE
ncbi:hypothetical protein HYG81_18495 [Natrinema zhouii]|uniref:ACT domain-containing protein n=1 Tax=Natrinema zhouii TaxID=1710539 RepID=A0A7D6GKF1_9EURY|nr:hypothetical protein [Natrinema zhouii]QLK26040.1 hypothetical protein HYG81_18495 [Natrinema zhouii]